MRPWKEVRSDEEGGEFDTAVQPYLFYTYLFLNASKSH